MSVTEPPKDTPFGLEPNVAAGLAYLFTLLGGIIMLVGGGTNKFVKWAAAQSITMWAVYFILWFVFMFIHLWVLYPILWLLSFVVVDLDDRYGISGQGSSRSGHRQSDREHFQVAALIGFPTRRGPFRRSSGRSKR